MNSKEEKIRNKALNKYLKNENKKWPKFLQKVNKDSWPEAMPRGLIQVWRSRYFLVQVFVTENGYCRLSICRAALSNEGNRWRDNISWDEIQELKKQCGFSDKAAVEIYPSDKDIINVANMRHIWVMPQPPEFMWSGR